MHLIDRSKLTVRENRQRKSFPEEAQQELTSSIERLGLQNPVVIEHSHDMQSYFLVSGERRLRSVDLLAVLAKSFRCDGQTIQPGFVPCTLLTELNEPKRYEAELEENINRLDLSWQERAHAFASLQKLRVHQHGAYSPANPEGWNLTKTAVEAGIAYSSGASVVRDQIIIAEHLADPDVAKAKDGKEAIRIIRKKKEIEMRQALAETYKETDDSIDMRCMEAHELMRSLPERSIDCIITDPPYGIGADSFGDQSALGHDYEDSRDILWDIVEWFRSEAMRICKENAHLYMFCSVENFYALRGEFTLAGWYVWPRPLIWAKGSGMLPQPERGPRYTYECILFAIKGEKKVNLVAPDVLIIPAVAGTELLHAAQKPIALFTDLLARSCLPGDRICDPFAGSFTAVLAAKKMKLNVVAGDKSPEAYATGVARLLSGES